MNCEICGSTQNVVFHEDTIHAICVDCHYKDKSRKWDNERKQDTLRILDMIAIDMTGDIWNLIEGIDSDMEALYEYPNKRLNELRDRIERLWGK